MEKSDSPLKLGLRFLVVGGAGAAAYVSLSALLSYLGLPTWLASFLSYATTIPVVYLGQRFLTFRTNAPHRSAFPKYAATQMLGLSLSAILPLILARVTDMPPNFTFVSVALSVAGINFVLMKKWAFKPTQK